MECSIYKWSTAFIHSAPCLYLEPCIYIWSTAFINRAPHLYMDSCICIWSTAFVNGALRLYLEDYLSQMAPHNRAVASKLIVVRPSCGCRVAELFSVLCIRRGSSFEVLVRLSDATLYRHEIHIFTGKTNKKHSLKFTKHSKSWFSDRYKFISNLS